MQTNRPEEFGDEQLVVLAQKGEREAFEMLIQRYQQKAYRIAFDFTRDREEAKDLSQEAFLRAFTHLRGFNRRSSFYTWFYRLLVNLCLDYRRRKSRVSWEPFDDKAERAIDKNGLSGSTSSPDQNASVKEISRKVGVALEALPPKQRTAFLLRNHQGLSIRDIAKVMQTAEGTVKVHLHRAVATLRHRLAEII
jgi:RNA polymerase sigma-70 factor (ECF subfamily)